MTKKKYRHIAVEDPIAREFESLKNNLRAFKKRPTDTEAMKILLEKNSKITLPKNDILKILLDGEDEE